MVTLGFKSERAIWELLRHLKKGLDKPWIVMGDFNEIAHSWEMRGGRDRQLWQMRDFKDGLEDCGLSDLNFRGDPFTFSNRRQGEKEVRERLDRAVANEAWRKSYPQALVRHGFSYTSDHSPLVIQLEECMSNYNTSIRRFEPMWLRHENFKRVVEDAWRAQSPSCSLSQKLKGCLVEMTRWGGEAFVNVKKRIRELKENIQRLRRLPRTDEVAREEINLTEELDEWLEREELWWRQRSRAEWLRHEDKNTAYFHARANQRRKRNHIDYLKNAEGEFCYAGSEIEAIVTSYLTNIFCSQVEEFEDRWRQVSRIIPRLVTEVTREVLRCLNDGYLDTNLNETLIVLIPKVKKVEKVEDLRPISLCNVVMKLIPKVLANRLKEILPDMVSQSQSAFVRGRLITDNILIAHEVTHYIKCRDQKKTGYVSLKLDMSKAYDKIEWRFLEQMMLALGFDRSWVKMVMLCVRSVSYKVRINNQISESIYPSRGLRQGDPISPYVFLLCAEWLNYAVGEYQELGLLQGIKIYRRALTVTHLMFADDCMLFFKAGKESVKWIRGILRKYEDISGQRVNCAKSVAVCSKNVLDEGRRMLVERLGVPIVEGHSSYLGLPLIFSNKKADLFRSIEEKIVKRITDWKHKLLSGAGREVLIKSVLQAIPTYAMSCFKLLSQLCRKLSKNIMHFWWNSRKNRGIHWVKAEEVYKDKSIGGLGFRRLELMNLALLAKQIWRFISSPQLLVSKIYKAKYFPDTDIFCACCGVRPSFAWRGICEALEILKLGTVWESETSSYRWVLDGSGYLTAKSTYQAALRMEKWRKGDTSEQSDQRETQRFWQTFWKMRIPNKYKVFGWRLFHDGLPTMQNLARRGCEIKNICCHCKAKGENSLHIFRDCWWTRKLLQDVGLPQPVFENQCHDPGYWLWLCAKLCKEEEFCALLIALWLVWKDRNEMVHDKEGRRIEELNLRLRWLLKEVRGHGRELSWWNEQSESNKDGVSIFCDGSYDEKSRIAGVGVILWKKGRVEKARARRFNQVDSVFQAECRAILEGLQLANESSLQRARFLTDSREALWAISSGSWRSEACLEELKGCIKLLDDHQEWMLGGIGRDSNLQADWLARKAQRDCWEWNESAVIPFGLPVMYLRLVSLV
ncbi:hypothetical protein QQ045_000116 [Rhodiola kirilowii]